MKAFLISLATIFLCMWFTIFQQDYNLHQLHLYNLRHTAEEAAAAASQYMEGEEYSEGRIVFNKQESIKAAEYIIKNHLKLQENFLPKEGSYYKEKINYDIHFFDYSNTDFSTAHLYQHPNKSFTIAIGQPTIVININAGPSVYRIPYINFFPDIERTAAHEWKERNY